ncbi:MAG: extracellular solute-binding protein family 1 [Clostridiales bacterium]|nr:extracellular solute-binding protein family 1 [Clostridiales bacterium]
MKKVLSIVLSLMMLTALLTGCGNKKDEAKDTDTKAPAVTDEAKDDTADAPADTTEPADTADTAETAPDISEPVTLKWYLEGSNVTDATEVLAKANEYLKEKLNVTLEPIWGTWGDFDTNSVLAINGGDDVDIYFTCSWTANEYNQFARNGAYLRLDDPENNLIEKYAPDLWKMLPTVLTQGATINGSDGYGVYAVPGYKDIVTVSAKS